MPLVPANSSPAGSAVSSGEQPTLAPAPRPAQALSVPIDPKDPRTWLVGVLVTLVLTVLPQLMDRLMGEQLNKGDIESVVEKVIADHEKRGHDGHLDKDDLERATGPIGDKVDALNARVDRLDSKLDRALYRPAAPARPE